MKNMMVAWVMGFLLSLQYAGATPVSYEFLQGGYAQGATVSGFFLGEDLDGDGQLSSFASEVLDFQLNFSGNQLLHSFSLDFADLIGLVYDLDGGVLGDGTTGDQEGLLAWDWHSLFAAGPGPLWQPCDGSRICSVAIHKFGALFSTQPILVAAAVPEPGAGFLLLIGILGLIIARRYNRNSVSQ